jgi:protein-ribulosamine 3-kinase
LNSNSEREALESFLAEKGLSGRIETIRPVGGGCIGDSQRIQHSQGDFFLKTMPPGQGKVLGAEAEGLAALAEPGVIPVPRVYGTGVLPDKRPFLLLEWVQQAPTGKVDQRGLGRNLAQLHRVTHRQYGWPRDNFIGHNPQPNTPSASWVQFFSLNRLGYQFELGQNRGLIDGDFARRLEALIKNLGDFLREPPEGPSLVHGDLWGGIG